MIGEKGKLFAEVKTIHILNLPLPNFTALERKFLIQAHDKIVKFGEKTVQLEMKKVDSLLQKYFPALNLEISDDLAA